MAESKYVVFELNGGRYGVPIELTERILGDQVITKIPRAPKMVLGIFEIRGETLPAVDLRTRFDLPESAAAANYVVVVTPFGRCACRVDAVNGIYSFDEKNVDPNPAIFGGKEDDIVSAVGKHNGQLIALLDVEKLIPESIKNQVKKSQPKMAAA